MVQTPLDVYESLLREGYRVDYYRVPLTDGRAPKVCGTIVEAHRRVYAVTKASAQGSGRTADVQAQICHRRHQQMLAFEAEAFAQVVYPFALQERDFGEFLRHIKAVDMDSPLIFNCQVCMAVGLFKM